MELKNKHVLITGGSRGIGEAYAYSFHKAGAKLSLLARESDSLHLVAKRVEGTAYTADLRNVEQIRNVIPRVEKHSGPIHILVNNAGLAKPKRFIDYSDQEIESIFFVNLIAPVLLTKSLIPRMIERGFGHIVNISSIGAIISIPGLTPYCSSKAGIPHFTACLRTELIDTPVKTTLVELSDIKGGGTLKEMNFVNVYPLTRQFNDLAHRLRLTVETPREVVADRVVEAVIKERVHVRIPTRLAPFFIMSELPRLIAERIWQRFGNKAFS